MIVLDLANRPYHDCFVNCYDSFVMFSAKLKPPSCINLQCKQLQLLGPTDYHFETQGPRARGLKKVPSSNFSLGKGPNKMHILKMHIIYEQTQKL